MYRHLFVPVDGSDLSGRAMHESIALAKQLGAAITGYVVEPDPPMPTEGTQMQQYERRADAHLKRTDAHAHDLLTSFAALAADAAVEFHGLHAATSAVDQAIADQALSSGCDMIVMTTHGRGLFGELLFGSHTKNVMARSKLPLLILR
jgi:nucleotide-binding universal stress UspA family protein